MGSLPEPWASPQRARVCGLTSDGQRSGEGTIFRVHYLRR
jgi:hypothetical protein